MCLSSKEVRLENQYKNLEAGNNTQAMWGHCILACSPFALLYMLGCPSQGKYQPKCARPSYINHW